MVRWRQGIFAFAIALAFVVSNRVHAVAQEQTPPCGGDEIARATVSRTRDRHTFTLADGREVRFAAIEVPLLPMPQGPDRADPPGGTAAKDALDALAGGDTVVLRRAEIASDRYGDASSPMPIRSGTAMNYSCRAK
jgi:hypothetical protein